MIQTLTVLSFIPGYARWTLLLAVLFVLYRRFSLPSLPWIAAYYAITVGFSFFAGQFFDFLREFVHSTAHGWIALTYVGAGSSLLFGLIKFLITLMLMLEVAYFVYSYCPEVHSKLLSRLVLVRKHVNLLGLALVALALVKPVTWLVLWLCRHPAATAAL